MVTMISVKCPDCGATLSIEEGRQNAFCSYCGSKVIINNENEIVYRHIDEARIKEAEAAREIRLKELELEEARLNSQKDETFLSRLSEEARRRREEEAARRRREAEAETEKAIRLKELELEKARLKSQTSRKGSYDPPAKHPKSALTFIAMLFFCLPCIGKLVDGNVVLGLIAGAQVVLLVIAWLLERQIIYSPVRNISVLPKTIAYLFNNRFYSCL
jgi:uncharacterized Zn finger protein (UPF0148 family)